MEVGGRGGGDEGANNHMICAMPPVSMKNSAFAEKKISKDVYADATAAL